MTLSTYFSHVKLSPKERKIEKNGIDVKKAPTHELFSKFFFFFFFFFFL